MKNKNLLILKIISFTIICTIFCMQIADFVIADEIVTSKNDNLATKIPKQSTLTAPVKPGKEKTPDKFPNIFFEQPNYNFGKVFRGNKVNHVFRFKNLGQGELKIEKARSSCGCTAAIISSKTIPFNEYGEIKVTFNTQSFAGNVTKKVTVYSNDPDNPKYRLRISGTVVEEVVVKPKKVDFSNISYNVGSSKDISVKSTTDLKLLINKVQSTNPNVTVSFKENEKKDGYVVNALLKKDTDYGRISGNIFIFTNSKNQSKIKVPFYGEVKGDLSVYPPRISFGIISQKREIVLPSFAIVYNKDIDVERVEVTPDFIDSAITKTKSKRKTYKIETTIKKNSPVGKVNGKLKIFTNSKKQPVIEIPILGTINKG